MNDATMVLAGSEAVRLQVEQHPETLRGRLVPREELMALSENWEERLTESLSPTQQTWLGHVQLLAIALAEYSLGGGLRSITAEVLGSQIDSLRGGLLVCGQ